MVAVQVVARVYLESRNVIRISGSSLSALPLQPNSKAIFAMNGTTDGSVTPAEDWQGRYYHVDQVLDKPGPSTDSSFSAGEPV